MVTNFTKYFIMSTHKVVLHLVQMMFLLLEQTLLLPIGEMIINNIDNTRLEMALEKIPVDAQSFGCNDRQKIGFKLAQILKQGEQEWTNYWQTNNYGLDQQYRDILKDFTSSYTK